MELAWLLTHSFTSFWLAFCWVSSVSWARMPGGRPKAGLQQPVLRLSKGVVSCYSWSCLLVGCLISFLLPVRVIKVVVLSVWCFSDTFSLQEALKTFWVLLCITTKTWGFIIFEFEDSATRIKILTTSLLANEYLWCGIPLLREAAEIHRCSWLKGMTKVRGLQKLTKFC